MPLETVQHRKVYLDAMNQIRRAILAGEYKLGDKLPSEHELVDIFQISRASVREALSGLTALGLIKSKAGGGYYVKSAQSFTAMELMLVEEGNPLEILEARKMIEPEIVQVAARRREKEDLEALDKVMERASLILRRGAGSLDDFINADMDIHRIFAQATHNDILVSVQERLIGYMKQRGWDELKRNVDSQPEIVKRYWNQHKAICTSIRKGQPLKASEQMRNHLQGITQDLLEQAKRKETSRPNNRGLLTEAAKAPTAD
jgi:GntR family transcriptional regulator, transcriptional repressor for pyruvate dehydrogenase complex